MTEEKRRRTRVKGHFTVTLEIEGRAYQVETVNISLNGILCETYPAIKAGTKAYVAITLGEGALISARGRVTRSDEGGLAVSFDHVDENGFFHLRRLVEWNLGDADLVERELKKTGFS